jgi:hypothetical protein
MKQKVAQKRRGGIRRKDTNAQRKAKRKRNECERNRVRNDIVRQYKEELEKAQKAAEAVEREEKVEKEDETAVPSQAG